MDIVRARRLAWTLGMDAIAHGASAAARALSKDLDYRAAGVAIDRDVPYAPRAGCALDVYRPAGVTAAPVVLYLHGGGFKLGSKRSHEPVALPFLRAGYVVVLVDYRLAPGAPYPAAVEDVADAFLWVVANIARHGGDPDRLVVAGESAGGNLTLALTLMTTRRHRAGFARRAFDVGIVPRVAMPLCGFLEASNADRYVADPGVHPIYRDRIESVALDYVTGHDAELGLALADPLVELERDEPVDRPLPPMFVSCGTRDPILPDSRRLGAVLQRRAVPHVLRIDEGEPHAYQVVVLRRAVRAHWDHALSFARPHLAPRGEQLPDAQRAQ